MKYYVYSLFWLLMAAQTSVLANGGFIEKYSNTVSGNIEFKHRPDLNLIKEELSFYCGYNYTKVKVVYYFTSPKKQGVTLAFPIIREIHNNENHWVGNAEYLNTRDYKIKANNQPQVFQYSVEKNIPNKSIHSYIDTTGLYGKSSFEKDWYLSDIDLLQGRNILEISYEVPNVFSDWRDMLIEFRPNKLRGLLYDLSAAKYWGDGIIDTLAIAFEHKDAKRGTITKELSIGSKKLPIANLFTHLAIGDTSYISSEWRMSNEFILSRLKPIRLSELATQKDNEWGPNDTLHHYGPLYLLLILDDTLDVLSEQIIYEDENTSSCNLEELIDKQLKPNHSKDKKSNKGDSFFFRVDNYLYITLAFYIPKNYCLRLYRPDKRPIPIKQAYLLQPPFVDSTD